MLQIVEMLRGWKFPSAIKLAKITLILGAISQFSAHADLDQYRYQAWEIRRPQLYRDYNFKAGPVYFDIKGRLAVTYDSNITRIPENPIDDIIFYPSINVSAMWEYSMVNSLTLNVGIGYEKFLENSQLDSNRGFLSLTPDSELAFSVSAGNLSLQVFDGFGYLTDATNTVGIGPGGESIPSAGRYGRFINRFGVRGAYPLNIVDLRFEAARMDEIPDDDERFNFRRHHEYIFRVSAERDFAANMNGGLGVTFSDTNYAESINNNGQSFSVGPFLNWSISKYMVFQGGVSHVWRTFETGGLNEDTTSLNGWAFNMEVFHDLNKYYNHSLILARNQNYGFVTNSQEIDSIVYRFDVQPLKEFRFNGEVGWEEGRDSGGQFAEEYERWTARLRTGKAWGPKFVSRFYVAWSDKISKLPERSYQQFLAGIELEYDF